MTRHTIRTSSIFVLMLLAAWATGGPPAAGAGPGARPSAPVEA